METISDRSSPTMEQIRSTRNLSFAFLLSIFTISSATFVPQPSEDPRPCVPRCRFRFCDGPPTILLLASQDFSVLPAICAGESRLVSVSKTGEARALVKGFLRPISTLSAKQPFSPSFFKILPNSQGVGIAHETPQADQVRVADGRCFVIPIKRFQVERDFLIKNGVGGRRKDCIAFTAELPDVVVELSWSNADDLDLVVVDPRGEELSVFSAVETRTGTLLADDGVSACGETSKKGREVSVYRGDIPKGVYTVFAKHWENCGRGTSWTIRIWVRGNKVGERRGFSDGDDAEVVKNSIIEFKV